MAKPYAEKFFFIVMLNVKAMRWLLGFIFHETAFGLLSVFIPLYITGTLNGSLTDVGVMSASASFAAVPFSFFWGYISEKTRQYKLYILISFAAISILLYAFSLTNIIFLLIIIYALTAIFQVAHETPKNVLISENYPQMEWEKGFGTFQLLTGLGWFIGLLLGLILSLSRFSGTSMILLCSLLNFIAFAISVFSVKDPVLIFERKLVGMERAVSLVNRGFYLFSKALDGQEVKERLGENVSALCFGLLVFTLTTSMLFTPLPVFFSQNLHVSESLVFGVFMLNSSGSLFGYFFSAKLSQPNDRAVVKKTTLARILFTFIAFGAVWFAFFPLEFSVLALLVLGITYGFFLISILSLSMELIPEGKAGVFNVLTGLGGATGCLWGSFFAENFGFPILLLITAIGFSLSYVIFRTLQKGDDSF